MGLQQDFLDRRLNFLQMVLFSDSLTGWIFRRHASFDYRITCRLAKLDQNLRTLRGNKDNQEAGTAHGTP